MSASLGRNLALADRHIAETEAHIAHQQQLLERAGSNAEWTARVQGPLHTMQEVLGRMREHRAKIRPCLRLPTGGPAP